MLAQIIERFPQKRIAVIGDVILDHYIWGDVSRISPEAPVPVVEVIDENYRLGGAANTVTNIRSLGGEVDVISVVGKDENGNKLKKMLSCIGANVSGVIEDDKRPTIIKTRVMAHNQQIVRVDRESKHEVEGNPKEEIICFAESAIDKVDAVIFSDYDKGVVSKELLEIAFFKAKKRNIPVIVDPKERNFWNYKGATVVTPNLKEASAPLGVNITDEESLLVVGNTLLEKLELSALLITKGEHGMSLFEAVEDKRVACPTALAKVTHISTVAREVFDVTGAGDTVVAVFTLALVAGASMLDTAKIANYAAGIVVGEIGTASVKPKELIEVLAKHE